MWGVLTVLQDSESAKDLVETLSETCQSALAVYLPNGNEPNARTNIQDGCTLKEMYRVDLLRSHVESKIISNALLLSSAEESCVDRFLCWNQLIRNRFVTQFEVKTAAGTWQSSQWVLEEIFRNFLDNEEYWGDTCRQEVRESRVRMCLAGSAAGRQLLDEKDIPSL